MKQPGEPAKLAFDGELTNGNHTSPSQPYNGWQRINLANFLWKYVASGGAETPSAVLAVLAVDQDPLIRKRCAENLNCNGEVLAHLSEDTEESVRAAVARNKHTPLFVLRKLTTDKSAVVRFGIAANPEMPDAILLSLFMDPDPYVAERASKTLAA